MSKQPFPILSRYPYIMKGLLLIFAVIFITPCMVHAQESWELRRDEDGIKIYSRRPHNGKIIELRLLTQYDATPQKLINILLDIDKYSEWIYGNKRAGVIKKVNDHDIIYFTEAHLPWPIQDRDLVTELTINPATPTTPLIIQAKSIQGILPPKPHYIRVPYSVATWHIVPEGNNKINIDYTFSLDPGGSIPNWLVNMTIASGPYKSFIKLRDILKAAKG
jgi:hypothetical protein